MRGRRVLVAIALAAAVAPSCAAGDIECEIDQAFRPAQQAEIRRAAATWNGFTTREITFARGGDWLILPALAPEQTLGYAQSGRQVIRISPDTPDGQVYAVALHEFGHALGLGHTAVGVMDPTRQTVAFSPADLAECRRAGACR